MSGFYGGSYVLKPLEPYVGLSVDKINFIVCQLVAIAAGLPFQLLLPANTPGRITQRHVVATLLGAAMCLFCFGYQIVHLMVQACGCLLLMRYTPKRYARYLVCAFAMLYLSFCHIMRLWYDPGGWTADVTGPLMIQTQRLSSLAFNLYDGEVAIGNDEQEKARLTLAMRKHLVRERPSLMEFVSYTLHFQGIMSGPFIFYSEFKDFMEGTIPKPIGVDPQQHRRNLMAWGRILRIIPWLTLFTVVSVLLPSRFPMEYLVDPECQQLPFVGKWLYLMAACWVIRQRYYFAWALGELSYLMSGCGFSGMNPVTNQPEYNIVKNFDYLGVELATSTKVAIDNWNIGTVHWLRECIYERAPSQFATLSVFVASAAWHGFYPGYYFMFVSVSAFTLMARTIRRRLRPLMLQPSWLKAAYDVATGVCALTTLNYCAAAHTLLEVQKLLTYWRSVYFFVHVAGVGLFAATSFLPQTQRPRSDLRSAAAGPVSHRD